MGYEIRLLLLLFPPFVIEDCHKCYFFWNTAIALSGTAATMAILSWAEGMRYGNKLHGHSTWLSYVPAVKHLAAFQDFSKLSAFAIELFLRQEFSQIVMTLRNGPLCSGLLPRTYSNSFWSYFLSACPEGTAYLGRTACPQSTSCPEEGSGGGSVPDQVAPFGTAHSPFQLGLSSLIFEEIQAGGLAPGVLKSLSIAFRLLCLPPPLA